MLHVWNTYQHYPHKWPFNVGNYTIHGAYGKYSYVKKYNIVMENIFTNLKNRNIDQPSANII